MKGMVFTEFLDMVDAEFGPDVLEGIIDAAELPNDGAYTAVGTYDHTEMFRLVAQLAKSTELPVPDLLNAFGMHLFDRLAASFPQFLTGASSALDFIANVESYIHPEVRKLYPDAELPHFDCQRTDDDSLTVDYDSPRCLAALAAGIMRGCARHFGETIEITSDDLSGGDGSRVRFNLVRTGKMHGRADTNSAAA